MGWPQIYSWSKRIHKISMWGVVALGVPQLITGLAMIWPVIVGGQRTTMFTMRSFHVLTAPYFAAFLALQLLTGLLMWGVPKIIQRTVHKTQ